MSRIECASLNLGDSRQQHVKNKEDLVVIASILHKPVIKHENRYYVLDDAITYTHRPLSKA